MNVPACHRYAVGILMLLALGGPAAFAEKKDPPSAESPAPAVTTCVVSGETLGEMGTPYAYVHKEEGKPDRTIQLCCKSCVRKFQKNPAKYLEKLDASKAPEGSAPKADADHSGHGD
jgi:hypothetical protein